MEVQKHFNKRQQSYKIYNGSRSPWVLHSKKGTGRLI